MKKSLVYVISFLVIFGCRKSDTSTTPLQPSVTIDNNEIYLDSFQRIVKVISIADDNKVKWISNYYYKDTIVIKSTSYNDSNIYISRYKIGQNGYAESSVDTLIHDQQVSTYHNNYFYDSADYLNSWVRNNYSNSFYEQDGDLTFYGLDQYSYYDTLNKIDIFWFPYYNGIVGKIYKHLIKEISGYYGLGAFQTRTFHYKLDSNRYVIEKSEIYKTQNTSKIEYYLTRYKYIFNYAP